MNLECGTKGHRALEIHGEHVGEVGHHGVDEVPSRQDFPLHHGVKSNQNVHHELLAPSILLGHG